MAPFITWHRPPLELAAHSFSTGCLGGCLPWTRKSSWLSRPSVQTAGHWFPQTLEGLEHKFKILSDTGIIFRNEYASKKFKRKMDQCYMIGRDLSFKQHTEIIL